MLCCAVLCSELCREGLQLICDHFISSKTWGVYLSSQDSCSDRSKIQDLGSTTRPARSTNGTWNERVEVQHSGGPFEVREKT